MFPGLQFHHTGVVVRDIPTAAADYRLRFGYELRSPVIHDPTQTALVQFLQLPGDSGYLELVTPDGPGSKLSGALSKGGGLNHICFAATDIEAAVDHCRHSRMLVIQAPIAAAAFPGRRIAWVIGQDLIPVELVERATDGGL